MIFAIDPGRCGGIVYGTRFSLSNLGQKLTALRHPQSDSEWLEILKLLSHYNSPSTLVVIERTEPFFRAKSNNYELMATAKLQWVQGAWYLATLKMRTYRPTPATWRKSVFGKATKHKGDWKRHELALAMKEFPGLNWGKQEGYRGNPPDGDHWIYGRSAACGLWIYGEKLLLKGGKNE